MPCLTTETASSPEAGSFAEDHLTTGIRKRFRSNFQSSVDVKVEGPDKHSIYAALEPQYREDHSGFPLTVDIKNTDYGKQNELPLVSLPKLLAAECEASANTNFHSEAEEIDEPADYDVSDIVPLLPSPRLIGAKQNGALHDSSNHPVMSSFSMLEPLDEFSEAHVELVSSKDLSIEDESSLTIALQVFFPFLVAGIGTVGAGLLLDKVQHWRVFEEVSEIFILVPALLGLKGNLEMTLASRLSTLANLGCLDTKSEMMHHVVGNLALIQAQAAVVAFLASLFAIVLGWIPKGEFVFEHAVLLCGSSMATAALASLILSAVMILVIIVSRHLSINPDNVATPIAASLGDLTTLGLLAAISTLLNNSRAEAVWLLWVVIAVFLLLVPLWVWIGLKNSNTRAVLENGWSPVIFSMCISSAGGFILDITVAKFHGIAVFQPVINGIGGNLVAVQASRLSTGLHRHSKLGVLPPAAPKNCPNPCATYFSSRVSSKAARVLLTLVVPGHVIFIFLIYFLKAGHAEISPLFVLVYLAAAFIQVLILLYICMWMVHFMWVNKIDPDNSAIPYLTAIGDLLGTALLAVVFEIVELKR